LVHAGPIPSRGEPALLESELFRLNGFGVP